MKIFIEKTGENKAMRFSGTVAQLLAKLKLNPEAVIIVKDGIVVTEDEVLTDKDFVRMLSVISGG
jgi:sulfur carrier protein ThiS